MFKEFKPIMKFVVPVLLAAGYAVEAALSDDTVSSTEWKGIVVAALTAVLVYLVPNKTEGEPVPDLTE